MWNIKNVLILFAEIYEICWYRLQKYKECVDIVCRNIRNVVFAAQEAKNFNKNVKFHWTHSDYFCKQYQYIPTDAQICDFLDLPRNSHALAHMTLHIGDIFLYINRLIVSVHTPWQYIRTIFYYNVNQIYSCETPSSMLYAMKWTLIWSWIIHRMCNRIALYHSWYSKWSIMTDQLMTVFLWMFLIRQFADNECSLGGVSYGSHRYNNYRRMLFLTRFALFLKLAKRRVLFFIKKMSYCVHNDTYTIIFCLVAIHLE